MKARLKPLLSLTLIAAALAAIFVGLANAQGIEDWLRLRNYHPPAAVTALASQDDMTRYAKHVFYVNHPELQPDVAAFRHKCVINEQTIVLGCYLGGQRGIEIYDVKDSRLKGIQQVTAAHEMLHAAYERLGQNDKQRIDAMLQDFYQHQLKDQRVLDTINAYKVSEPNELVNEMHSIFGTEVADLPVSLEQYYSKYFVDRSQVTTFAASYETEFTSRSAAIDNYDTQLAGLRQKINSEEQTLRDRLSDLQSARGRIENSHDQSEIDSYNAQVNTYNQGVRQLQRDITTYNSLVEQRNALATELKSLQGSIDTRLSPQVQQ